MVDFLHFLKNTSYPGRGILVGKDRVYYFIMGQNALALDKGVETFKIAVAIALGIVLVLSLPYSFFGRRKPADHKTDGG